MSRTTAFWDSSALVPLCVTEQTTEWAKELALGFSQTVWWGSPVEISGAIARLHRAGTLHELARQSALDRLMTLTRGSRQMVPDAQLRDRAFKLLFKHPLRAADSLQLAAALTWCEGRPAGRRFICADIRLCEAAAREGFTIIQPE